MAPRVWPGPDSAGSGGGQQRPQPRLALAGEAHEVRLAGLPAPRVPTADHPQGPRSGLLPVAAPEVNQGEEQPVITVAVTLPQLERLGLRLQGSIKVAG